MQQLCAVEQLSRQITLRRGSASSKQRLLIFHLDIIVRDYLETEKASDASFFLFYTKFIKINSASHLRTDFIM